MQRGGPGWSAIMRYGQRARWSAPADRLRGESPQRWRGRSGRRCWRAFVAAQERPRQRGLTVIGVLRRGGPTLSMELVDVVCCAIALGARHGRGLAGWQGAAPRR